MKVKRRWSSSSSLEVEETFSEKKKKGRGTEGTSRW